MVQGEAFLRTGWVGDVRSLFSGVVNPTLAMANCSLTGLVEDKRAVEPTWSDTPGRTPVLVPQLSSHRTGHHGGQ